MRPTVTRICWSLLVAALAAPAWGAARLPAAERYRITSPADGAKVAAGPVVILVEGVDGAAFERVRLSVDGDWSLSKILDKPETRFALTWQAAQVRPGGHKLIVDVYADRAVFARLRLRLVVTAAAATAAAPVTAAKAPLPEATPPAGLSPLKQKLWSARRLVSRRPQEAEDLARQALAECDQAGDADGRTEALSCLRVVGQEIFALGHRAFIDGAAVEARPSLERAAAIARDTRDVYTLFGSQADLIELLAHSGDMAGAQARLAKLDEALGQISFSPSVSQFRLLLRYAAALSAVGRGPEACACLDKAATMLAEIEQIRQTRLPALATQPGTAADGTRLLSEAIRLRDWLSWSRAYVDVLKAQATPSRAGVQSVSVVHGRVCERLTELSKQASALQAPSPTPLPRGASRSARGAASQLQSTLADALALQAEISTLATKAGISLTAPAADGQPGVPLGR